MKALKVLVSSAVVLAMLVILLGAYTRLTDAGLGCPDWPGCYGFLKVPSRPIILSRLKLCIRIDLSKVIKPGMR